MPRTELSNAWAAFVIAIKPNAFITLGEGMGASAERLQTDARHFLNRLQREGRGRRWDRWPKHLKPQAVGFVEEGFNRRHMHIAAHLDDDLRRSLRTHGKDSWGKQRRGGDLWYDPPDSLEAVARYITKHAAFAASQESIFIYNQ